jgi:glyoxylase-like metal-dependent hydrolase (beta-lactamase superfamily II)
MIEFTRRHVLARTAAFAVTPALTSTRAWAAAPLVGTQGPGIYRTTIGRFELTALYDGTWFRKVDGTFVRNAGAAKVNATLAAAFLPPDIVPTSFTALLVNTRRKLVLIDTGTAGQLADSAGTLLDNMKSAGVQPNDVDTVLISHFHPDHIDGLKTKDGEKIFPNAEVMVPEPEWKFWMDDANLRAAPENMKTYFLNSRRIFSDIAKEVTLFTPGKELVPGIVSIPAFGHTPGHTAFSVASGNESMLVLSDVTNHPWLFARHPDWQGSFDVDGPLAVKTRKRMLDRAAADKMLVQGYHFPFPASGYIVKTKSGYDVAPAMWRPL